MARTTTAVDLFNERSFARDLAAFNSAAEGASLRDHVEDLARAAIRALPGSPKSAEPKKANNKSLALACFGRGPETIVGVWVHLWRDSVAQDADPFDLDLHDVPWFEIARGESVAYRLANRPASHCTPAKYVARNDSAVPRGALDH